MNFNIPLDIVQIILAVALTVLILLQSRSSAFSAGFSSDAGSVYRSRRGLELLLFRLTIITAGVFLLVVLINAFTSQNTTL